jgi:phage shock protein PspC (stress-responsive transcriptional regulator)
MGPKGIFLAFLIVCSIYLWRRHRKKAQAKTPGWVNWVLGGIAVYYGISMLLMIFNSG